MAVPSIARRIAFYCQHLSGVGHYMRSRELVREMARFHEVHFVVGGVPVPSTDLGPSVNVVTLPAIRRAAGVLAPIDSSSTICDTMIRRKRALTRTLEQIRPETLFIEHFPLGKWELRDELLSAIRTVRSVHPAAQVIASVRDLPASNELRSASDGAASEIVATLNSHFTALFVHSDPRVIRFESQFRWASEIRIPIHHTGYVSQRAASSATTGTSLPREAPHEYVVVSSGGLDDDDRLARLCIAAWRLLDSRGKTARRRMIIVAGLNTDAARYEELARSLQNGPFHLRRFGADFLTLLQGAALSISQAGYNTTMNVLETRVRAILAPNPRMMDQRQRARILRERGLVESIDVDSITPEELADCIATAIARPPVDHDLSLNGAEQTLKIWEHHYRPGAGAKVVGASSAADSATSFRTTCTETIPRRIARFAAQRPLHPAIRTPSQTWTYGELNTESNRIAHILKHDLGNSSRPAAILVEQSGIQALAIVGALKSGRCSVPLQPSHPRQRLEYILRDSRAEVLITNNRHLSLAQLLAGDHKAVINVDTVDDSVPSADPDVAISPDTLASITYTSGSTGHPKGVVHTHRTTLYLGEAAGAVRITPDDRVASIGSTISFNRILLHGATSYPWDVRTQGFVQLADWLRSEAITVILTVPSVLRSFLETPRENKSWPHLRRIVLTGETLYRTDIDLFREHFPPECLFINELGSSETKTYAQYSIEPRTDFRGEIVPVGVSLPGRRISLVRDDGSTVQPGEVGEIVVHSRNLSPGYWEQPELTEARFRPDLATEGERVYYTGDLAYQAADGNFVHVGRKDFQLKIRGQRVELAEVEAALRRIQGVREAVVVARDDQPGNVRLVGYVVPESDSRLTVSVIVQALRERLPDHMLPTSFVLLDALPMTPNGKVNRRGLPPPGILRPSLASPYVAPRCEAEELLAQLWSEVLGIDQVGVQDDFFDLGGNSLRAAQLFARIAQRFEVRLPLRDIFRSRTIQSLADTIASSPKLSTGRSLIASVHPGHPESATRCPASYAQRRLWLVQQIHPSVAYNESIAWRLTGPLHVDALRQALRQLVDRHEILRTTLFSADGDVWQSVGPPRDVELVVHTLEPQPDEQANAAHLDEFLVQKFQQPFDLSRDLMLRATLVRFSENEHVLALTLHHIAMDGWSNGILTEELAVYYNAARDGEEPQLPKLCFQYADYARWQREHLNRDQLSQHIEYWARQLKGAPEAVTLPGDRGCIAPCSADSSNHAERHSLQLDPLLLATLNSLSREAGTTLFVTMASAFATLLGRCADSSDVVFGTPVAGRHRIELERLIGFFVNTVVLRIDLSGDPTFRELLRRVHETVFDAFSHQEAPFDVLVEELRPQRRPGQLPLFNISFAMQNAPRSALRFRGVEACRVSAFNRTSKFDLYFGVTANEQGMRVTAEARADLFSPGALERFVGLYVTLLNGILANADLPLSALPIISPDEQRRLLVDWNATASDFPAKSSISQLFEEQVERTPSSVAVVDGERELTYRELNEFANQLADHLTHVGVVPASLVGLCLERSSSLIVGILAILKAGAAYVPLDPDYPAERIRRMKADSKFTHLVTSSSLLSHLPEMDGEVVCLDRDPSQLERRCRANPIVTRCGEDIAYVVYTSGSTGTPKGVAVPHRAISRLVLGCDYATFGPDRVFLLLAPISFDASTFEIWGALLHGARLVVTLVDGCDFRELERLVKRHQITTLWLTASLFNQVVDHDPCLLSGVSEVLTGGEALSPPHIIKAQRALGRGVQIINGYGPTECTTFSTCYRIPFPMAEDKCSIPIGRPIGNTRVYVLDRKMQPVPVGVPGELFIGGDGLALGYLHNRELTAERFVASPFSDAPDSRLYRTSDRCRWRADGQLEFLGRLDQQVKLRGFRIEPGEIEAVLSRHSSVAQCAVLLKESSSGNKQLVAYYVPIESGKSTPDDELAGHLRKHLPAWMVPSRFVPLAEMHLTSSGKIDRQALSAIHEPLPVNSRLLAPNDEVEQQLLKIWQSLFGRDVMGVEDNFFDLGGHSLLAARLSSEIEKQLRHSLPIRAIFHAPTIRSQAGLLRDAIKPESTAAIVPLQPRGSRRPFLFVHGWGGDLFHFVKLACHFDPDQPVYGLQAKETHEITKRPMSLEAMCAGYVREIRSFQPQGPYSLCGYSLGGWIAYEIAQQLGRQGQTVELLALLDTHATCRLPPMQFLRFSSVRLIRDLASRVRFHSSHCMRLSWREMFQYGRGRLAPLRRRLLRILEGLSATERSAQGDPAPATGDFYQYLTERYRPAKYHGSLHLFTNGRKGCKLTRLFESLVTGTVVVHTVEGDHFTMIDDEHVSGLADGLQAAILAARRNSASRCNHDQA